MGLLTENSRFKLGFESKVRGHGPAQTHTDTPWLQSIFYSFAVCVSVCVCVSVRHVLLCYSMCD